MCGQEGGVNKLADSQQGLAGPVGAMYISILQLCPEREEGGSNSGKLEGGGIVVVFRVKIAKDSSNITLIDIIDSIVVR